MSTRNILIETKIEALQDILKEVQTRIEILESMKEA